MTLADILGYAAAVGTTCAFIPQAYKVFKTKKTNDLSVGTFMMFCAGLILWVIYGFVVTAIPIILANSLTFVMAFYILIMIFKHGKNTNNN
ncbi:MAG: SemiSWEET transporter [Ignavibacteria bacterium]|nr:SemiSWEET transporter [Ignavibacteria bacterium]MDP3582919.1 SemiSWEET transporter [Ignavibacteria bacterium]